MSDNTRGGSSSGSDPLIASDEVTYSGDTADVQLARIVAVTGAEGTKTVVENMPASLGQKTKAASFPVVFSSDSDAFEISGAVTASGTLSVEGTVAHDAADSGKPVKVGGVAIDFESMPADVAIGDRVNAAYTPKGIAGVALFHPTLSTPLEIVPVSVSSGEVSVSVIGAGDNNIGNVDVVTSALPTGASTAANQLLPTTATTATLTNTNDSASNVTVQASNAARKGLILFNDSTQVAYVKFGATATITSFSVYLPAQGTYEMGPNVYSGIVDCIWAADGAGAMRATEW